MNYRHGWDRHRRRNNDQGTSLLIVLIIVTMIGLAMSALLSQVDTSVKSTIVLRDQAASNYGADAAAQAAVTQLSKGSAFGSACTTPATTTTSFGTSSNPFYQASNTTTGSLNATVTCTPDAVTGVTATVTGTGTMVGPTNTPTATVTTVGSTVLDGVVAVGVNYLCVQGSVRSYTAISGFVSAGVNQQNSATACPNAQSAAVKVQAYGNPIPFIPGCLGSFIVTPCTAVASNPAIPTVPDPGLAVTAANTNQAAVCTTTSSGKTYAAFRPGLYKLLTSTTVSSLSTPCKVGGVWVQADVDWFTPGVYYFDFGSTTWRLPAAVVGGTPATGGVPIAGLDLANPATLANLSQMPTGEGKCISPTAQTQAGMGGVEFVFGGASTMTGMTPPTNFLNIATGPSTDMDLCATYSATSPPVAIYGVYKNPLTEGSVQIPPQSGCVASTTCLNDTRSLINAPSPIADQTFHIDGYVWAPASAIAMSYVNAAGQAFNWGVLVRTFQISTLGPARTMVALPAPNVGQVTTYTYSIRYVNVWTCAASSTPCPTAGSPDVRVKLQNTGSTWKVLSWTALR